MRLGFALPQVGGLCDPTVIAKAVQHAEELGYASGWVNDRMLWPTAPKAAYPASAGGSSRRATRLRAPSASPATRARAAAAIRESIATGYCAALGRATGTPYIYDLLRRLDARYR